MKYLLYLLLAASSLAGCVKDELSMLILGSRTITILPEGTARVAITSGNGSYAAVSDHPEIATVELQGDTLLLAAQAMGAATVTVTDSKGQDAELKITVGTKKVRFTIVEYTTRIEPDGIAGKEAVETELLRTVPLPAGAYYECEYLTATRPDGNLTVVIPQTETEDEIRYTGTFLQEAPAFTFQYGDKTYKYTYEPSEGPSKSASYLLFLEDGTALTAEYQTKFPDAGLTLVNRGQIVRIAQ